MTDHDIYFIPTPEKCDTCGTTFSKAHGTRMYDAATTHRGMCATCFNLGPGIGKLGTGLGQEYERRSDGKFWKIAG